VTYGALKEDLCSERDEWEVDEESTPAPKTCDLSCVVLGDPLCLVYYGFFISAKVTYGPWQYTFVIRTI